MRTGGQGGGQETDQASEASCRICHGLHSLLRACECRGSCARVHAGCLEMWIAHRKNSGMSTEEATTCELCLGKFSHRLEREHIGKFLLSRGAWRAWMHIAYLGYCGRRFCGEGSSIVRALSGGAKTGFAMSGRWVLWQRGRTWPKMRVTAMLALHYWLLFMLDARILFNVFRRWRDLHTRVVVCEKAGGGDEDAQGDEAAEEAVEAVEAADDEGAVDEGAVDEGAVEEDGDDVEPQAGSQPV